MDSRLAARLERVHLLNEPDLAALPKRSPSLEPATTTAHSGSPEDGGISLDTSLSSAAREQESEYVNSSPSVGCTVQTPSSSDLTDAPASQCSKQTIPHMTNGHTTAPDPGCAASPNGNNANADQERRFVWVQGTESSYNLGSKPSSTALPANVSKLPPTDLQRCQLAPESEKYFTPIVALSKYPYKFCDKNWKQTIASTFFDEGKFWARGWDL